MSPLSHDPEPRLDVTVSDGERSEPYELNLGAAKTFIPGFVNIDIHERAELSLDLGVDKLPFPDNSVSTVVSHHTLEHVSDYLFALSEIHRVLRHDGALLLSLPYATLTEHHLVNPYHRHNFTERAFDFFDPDLLRGSAAEDGAPAFRSVFVRFTYLGWFGMAPAVLRVWARRHLFNVVRQFDIALVAIKDLERPVDASEARARELEGRIVELKRLRTRYPNDEDQAPPTDDHSSPDRRSGSPARRAGGRLGRRLAALQRHWEIRRD
jgi:SAM-dependent methyltransferase